MLKNIAGILVFLSVFLPSGLFAIEGRNDWTQPDQVRWTSFQNSVDTEMARIDFQGNFIPGRNGVSNIGESTHAWKNAFFNNVFVSSGFVNVHESYSVMAASNAVAYGSFLITTATLRNNGTTYAEHDLIQTTGVPRNVVIVSSFALTQSSTVLSGGATFYGTDARGFKVSEYVQYFATSIAAGNVAWVLIDSVTIQVTSAAAFLMANVTFNIGVSNKIGLANTIDVSSDIYKISCSTGIIRLGNTVVNATFNTIDLGGGAVPVAPNNSRSYDIWYTVKKRTPSQNQ